MATTYSTSLNFSRSEPQFEDGDESDYVATAAGTLAISSTTGTNGNLQVQWSSLSVTGVAINDTDGDDDAFSDSGSGTTALSGSLTTGSSISGSWNFGSNASATLAVSLQGSNLTGNLTITESTGDGTTASYVVPVTLPSSNTPPFPTMPMPTNVDGSGTVFSGIYDSEQEAIAQKLLQLGLNTPFVKSLFSNLPSNLPSNLNALANFVGSEVNGNAKAWGSVGSAAVAKAASNLVTVAGAFSSGLQIGTAAYQNGVFSTPALQADVKFLAALGTAYVGEIVTAGAVAGYITPLIAAAATIPVVGAVTAGALPIVIAAGIVGVVGYTLQSVGTYLVNGQPKPVVDGIDFCGPQDVQNQAQQYLVATPPGGQAPPSSGAAASTLTFGNTVAGFGAAAPQPGWMYNADDHTFTWLAPSMAPLTQSLSQMGVTQLAAPLTISGDNNGDLITGGPDGDHLTGGSGNDVILGGSGNNVISGGAGTNILDGGSGDDSTLTYAAAPGPVLVNFLADTAQNGYGGVDTFSNFQTFVGGAKNDTFIGGPGNHILDGGAGFNTLDYSAATGGVQFDLVHDIAYNNFGGSAVTTDTFSNIGQFVGGSSNDTFIAGPGGSHGFDGGGGINTLSYAAATSEVYVDLMHGLAYDNLNGSAITTDTFSNIEQFVGGSGNDTFIAGPGSNHFFNGGGGVNTLSYAAATSEVYVDLTNQIVYDNLNGPAVTADSFVNFKAFIGGSGNNVFISSGPFGDIIDGGAGGINSLQYGPSTQNITFNLAADTATANGVSDIFANMHNLIGGGGVDTFVGGPGNHTLDGGGNANILDYSAATTEVEFDIAHGLAYNNFGGPTVTVDHFSHIQIFKGGSGNDVVLGGPGNNVLDGGGGINTLNYAAAPGPVTVNLGANGGTAGNGYGGTDTFANFKAFIGGSGNDVFISSGPFGDIIDGGAGGINSLQYGPSTQNITFNLAADTATANGVSDIFANMHNLIGGGGVDTFVGGPGNHTLDGGGNANILDYSAATTEVEFDIAHGLAYNNFGGPTVTVDHFSHIQVFDGGSGNNVVDGGPGNNALSGGVGGINALNYSAAPNPVTINLTGGPGAGTASNGYGGTDTFAHFSIFGGGAGAIFNATNGPGSYVLIGGQNNDIFEFSSVFGNGTVTDFAPGHDHIYLAKNEFANFAAVQSHAAQVGSSTVITLNAADTITLQNVQLGSLNAGQFLFL